MNIIILIIIISFVISEVNIKECGPTGVSSELKCVDCEGDKYLDNGNCVELEGSLCQKAINGTCTECADGYCEVFGECRRCHNSYFFNSIKYDGHYYSLSSSHCTLEYFANCKRCEEGYYLYSNICVSPFHLIEKCMDSRKEGNDYICSVCEKNYYSLGNSCGLCTGLEGCTSCENVVPSRLSSYKYCYSCESGYYLFDGQCIRIPNCQQNINETCIQCELNYLLINGSCFFYSDFHCSSVISNTCEECEEYYFLNSSSLCSLCGSNCINCIDSLQCKVCEEGLTLYEGKCIECDLIGCESCSVDSYSCLKCEKGYYLDNGKCNSCNIFGSCIECTISGCIQCKSNNILSTTNCVECNSIISNCTSCYQNGTCSDCISPTTLLNENECIQCPDIFTNCIECSLSGCTTCKKGNYLNSTCYPCENMKGCSTCSQTEVKCFSCIEGYKYDPLTYSCKDCQSLHQWCLGCNSEMECIECEKEYTLIDGRCIPCIKDSTSECIKGPSNCDVFVNNSFCIDCDNGYVLRSGYCYKYLNNINCISINSNLNIGCEGCKNSLTLDGQCSSNEKTNNCSFYIKQSSSEQECIPYYSSSIQLDNCLIVKQGRCVQCKYNYYLNNQNPPICSKCDSTCSECSITSTHCLSCSSRLVMPDITTGTCDILSPCISGTTFCNQCLNGYYLLNSKCHKCSLPHCIKCYYGTNNEICSQCDEESVLINGSCNLITDAHCSFVQKETSLCKRCEVGYSFGMKTESNKCIYSDSCKYSINGNCLLCKSEYKLTKNNNRKWVCLNKTMDTHCSISSPYGCLRCMTGYYLKDGICSSCDNNCRRCINNSKQCVDCEFGMKVNDSTSKCYSLGDSSLGCLYYLHNSYGCAICKNGYFVSNLTCFHCYKGCKICTNEDSCIECNGDKGYFKDIDNQCYRNTTIEHCLSSNVNGCTKCENGYFINKTRCGKCSEHCQYCSKIEQCDSCKNKFVLVEGKCILYSEIDYCFSAEHSRCSYCLGNHEVSSNGTYCNYKLNYFLVLGLPVIIITFILLIILLSIIVSSIIIYKCSKSKKEEEEFTIFDIKTTNIKFMVIDQTSGLSINKNQINFMFDENNLSELPIEQETRDIICIGNLKTKTLKVQLFLKDQSDKYDIKIEPPMAIIKKGKAIEIQIIVIPHCTCTINETMILLAVNLKKGKQIEYPIKIKFSTVLSTHLDPDELIIENKLGEGSFGIVYLGMFRGNQVAIKKMKQITCEDCLKQLEEFYDEVAMLDKFRNEYIIHFYGAVFIPNKISIVTEYAKYGSLKYLIKHKERFETYKLNKFLLDAAKGISYLHQNNILHRDIKPDNILIVSIDDNISINCKLTDFGSSRNINMMMTNMTFTKGIGTPAYMAPEILNKNYYKMPADIYSFAITMYEVWNWKIVYQDKSRFRYPWDIATFVTKGLRLEQTELITDEQYDIITHSWNLEPKERMKIDEIINRIEQLKN
ncbi:serine/threonine kinase, putative [Entamoeba histolytica HM-3:IMSS]|uniref:Serine/threonine kinase, putative n=2 Tax=Entamoeba histolytica TaxID=5759 RepID=M2RUV0_ENTHI|nr:serine/threonine kinase, putative [Entamoeba histolytica KU27]EMS16545.1 serine/threonine kinase, putative [Entamoeba histolytica HM-3:IMSS]